MQNLNIEYGKVAEQQLTDRDNEMGGKTLQTEWAPALAYLDSCVYLANLQCQIDIIWRRWWALSWKTKQNKTKTHTKKKTQLIYTLHMHIYLFDAAANSAFLWVAPLQLTNFSLFAQLVLADTRIGWWSILFRPLPCQIHRPSDILLKYLASACYW